MPSDAHETQPTTEAAAEQDAASPATEGVAPAEVTPETAAVEPAAVPAEVEPQPEVVVAETEAMDVVGEIEAVAEQAYAGPRSWPEMKAWIRKELDLHAQGVDHNERELQNP